MLDDYQIHDVCNALKRFFRTLDSPLLTLELYSQWINAASMFLSLITSCLGLHIYLFHLFLCGKICRILIIGHVNKMFNEP